MIKKKNWLTSLTLLPIASLALVSCGVVVDSPELTRQKEEINSTQGKNYIESFLIQAVLKQNYGNGQTNLDDLIKDTNSNFYKELVTAFNFYQNQKLQENKLYFVSKVNEWKSKNFLKDDSALQPSYGQKLTTQQFLELYDSVNTGIKIDILKMLFVQNFLNNVKKEELEKYSKFTNATKNGSSSLYSMVNPKDPSYFLNLSLLEKQLSQSWTYESSSASALASFSAYTVKDLNSFNSLFAQSIQDQQSKIDPNQVIAVNDNIDIAKLSGYKGAKINSSKEKGDLNFDTSKISNETNIKSGFVSNDTSLVWSSGLLANAAIFNQALKEVPTLTGVDVTNVDIYKLTTANFQIPSSKNGVSYKIIDAIAIDKTTTTQKIRVVVEASVNDAKYNYPIEFIFNNSTFSSNPALATPFNIPSSIPVYDSTNKKISITYFNKIVPLLNEAAAGENKDKPQNYYSLKNTPWESQEQKLLLAFLLNSLDPEIYSTALEFYKDQGFEIKYNENIVNNVK